MRRMGRALQIPSFVSQGVSATMPTTTLLALSALAVLSALAQDLERPATNEPQFVSRGERRVVREGQDIELECEVHDLGEFVILWKFNRTHVLFAGNLRIHRDDRISRDDHKGSLRVKNFRPENAGEYSCQISTNPPKEIVYDVTVVGPPQIRAHPPQRDISVQKLDAFRLRCDASDDSRVEWRRPPDERVLSVGPELTRDRVQPEDAGLYQCSAHNAIGKSSHDFFVRVLHEPRVDVTSDVVHAPIGHRVRVECAVSAEPPAWLTWTSETRPLDAAFRVERANQSAALVVDAAREDLYGNYTCSANNSLGATHARVELTGRPSRAHFTSGPLSGRSDGYLLEWRVDSQSPITRYEVLLRSAADADWTRIQVPTPEPSSAWTRADAFLLEGLQRDGNYEVQLDASNRFGRTRSHVFAFVTSAATTTTAATTATTLCLVLWFGIKFTSG